MSPAISAQPNKSTGPRSEEGKKRSALNAMRHGLTGRTVVMPHEDMEAYKAFCNELFVDLAPETALERVYAQAFCDTQWRLNRARSIEDAMIALGHCEAAGEIRTEHPQVHAALTAGRVFRDDSKSFANLSLYEQRLQRTLDKSLLQLQTLQAARRRAVARAEATSNSKKIQEEPSVAEQQPATEQFVCSTAASRPATAQPSEPPTLQTVPNFESGAGFLHEPISLAPAA
jgi:hypothetical protein